MHTPTLVGKPVTPPQVWPVAQVGPPAMSRSQSFAQTPGVLTQMRPPAQTFANMQDAPSTALSLDAVQLTPSPPDG